MDYDFPAAPTLIDIEVDGRPIKALAPVSKQGFTYVFDRATGEPVWPIEERAVETDTDLEGEVLSPTQPFPTKPPPFEYQGISIDDLVDFTPEIRALAVEAVRNFRLGPLFTPPMLSVDGGLQGTIQRPHIAGGATWGGAAADPETGLLYVPSRNSFSVIKYYTPDPDEGGNLRYTQADFDSGTQPRCPRACRCSSRPTRASPPSISTKATTPGCSRTATATATATIRGCATWTCRRSEARDAAGRS